MEINRTPITQIPRVPAYNQQSKFQTCELCYGRKNCCKCIYASGKTHKIKVVDKDFENWDKLEEDIIHIRAQGNIIRLITEKDIPDKILWAIAYDHRNLLQINADISTADLGWTANLAHASERCGIFFVFMVYPILPGHTQTYHVLTLIDAIRSIPHCVVMLRFAVFKNSGKLSSDTDLNVNGQVISKEYIYEIKSGIWRCTDMFKQKFFNKIKAYAEFQPMAVDVCGGVG